MRALFAAHYRYGDGQKRRRDSATKPVQPQFNTGAAVRCQQATLMNVHFDDAERPSDRDNTDSGIPLPGPTGA
jgi:hypothetical protein